MLISNYLNILLFYVLNQLSSVTSENLESPAPPRSSFENQLVARQFGFDYNCGLDFNAFGQVSPLNANGQANLCLQCRFNLFGILSLDFSFLNSLSSTINSHGVSASDAYVLQNSIQSDLNTKAAQQQNSAQCQAAFANDQRCASSSFVNGQCKATAINCVKNNRNGPILAQAFRNIFQAGGSPYCSICSGDRSCTNPSARAAVRRNLDAGKKSNKPRCPTGLTACPISNVSKFTPSTAYECLDTKQEISSCGGCVTLGQGKNCSALRGTRSSGCSDGKCTIFSCARGFTYSKREQACTRVQHHLTRNTH